ncbi:TolC family protein, partial [Verrucomicrobiota bacterium]
RLPARDIIVSLKQEYQAFLSQDRSEGATELGLNKLFPRTGTEISASYETSPAFGSDETQSELSFSLSQPIARNAFGRSTRLLERIVGMEVEVARHQIVEAYEDYLAGIMIAYLGWHESFENLAIARSSYRENRKLLDNIRERQSKQVARPIDVNKIGLQVLAKKERLIELEEEYQNRLHTIERVVRHVGRTHLVPEPSPPGDIEASFDPAFRAFTDDSRTFSMLRLLEEKSSLEVDKEADDLLPSLELLMGYDVHGEDYGLEQSDDKLWLGVRLDWPFPQQVDKAEHEVAKIDLKRVELRRVNTRHRLYEDARNLFHEIQREKKLMAVATNKIALAQSVLKDETENYSYGRVSLNDYIAAVNVLDNNSFNKVLHEARYKKLVTEWLRLTDRLITRKKISERHQVPLQ